MTELPADKNTILAYVLEKYGTTPDYPWSKYPDYLVLRHSSSRKWYAVIMRIPLYKLGVDSNTSVDIINIKCEPELIGSLRQNLNLTHNLFFVLKSNRDDYFCTRY